MSHESAPGQPEDASSPALAEPVWTDIKLLGYLTVGTTVALNGKQLVVSDISVDLHGSEQITFLRPDEYRMFQERRQNRGIPL